VVERLGRNLDKPSIGPSLQIEVFTQTPKGPETQNRKYALKLPISRQVLPWFRIESQWSQNVGNFAGGRHSSLGSEAS